MDKESSRTKTLETSAIGLVIRNIDLVFEIFLRLPVESLIRFKLVSKSWLSLISDREFAIAHTRRNTAKSAISNLYYQDYSIDLSISLHGRSSFPALTCLDVHKEKIIRSILPSWRFMTLQQKGGHDPKIVHSCNGLILLKPAHWRLIVLNPTTQSYKLLPIPSDFMTANRSYESFLAFEPLKSHHYKIVIFIRRPRQHTHILLFSSESGSWIKFPIISKEHICCTRKIYWNGAIHWLGDDNFHHRFDVDAEKMIETQLPPKLKVLSDEKNEYFGESNGRLFLVQGHKLGAPGFLVLEMDTNTLCWGIKHRVNLRPLLVQFPESNMFAYSVLYIKSGDDRKSFSLVLAINRNVVLYDVKGCKSRTNINVICEFPYSFSYYPTRGLSRCVHPMIQCLVPI